MGRPSKGGRPRVAGVHRRQRSVKLNPDLDALVERFAGDAMPGANYSAALEVLASAGASLLGLVDDTPGRDLARDQVRIALMSTGALTLDEVDRYQDGVTSAVIGAYAMPWATPAQPNPPKDA